MKEVVSYRADSGRLFASPKDALRDDAIVQICNTIGVSHEAAEKIVKNWRNIWTIMDDLRKKEDELTA